MKVKQLNPDIDRLASGYTVVVNRPGFQPRIKRPLTDDCWAALELHDQLAAIHSDASLVIVYRDHNGKIQSECPTTLRSIEKAATEATDD